MPPDGEAAIRRSVAGAEEAQPRLRPISAADFLTLELPPREMLLDPWLPARGLALLHGYRGGCKTLLALGIAYAVAAGGEILGWHVPRCRRVVFVDGEMPAETMQNRLAAAVAGLGLMPPYLDYFQFLAADLTEGGLPDLGSDAGQREFDGAIGDAELIVLDSISTLVRSGKENEAEGWLAVQSWALGHRRAGRSIVFLHHDGKSGAQRGTSRKEDVLDTVIGLRRPPNYSPDQGARFEVHFEKARGFFGEEARPFEARYETRDRAAFWTRTEIRDADLMAVVDALKSGLSIRKAAAELGLDKAKVERLKRRGVERGLLDG